MYKWPLNVSNFTWLDRLKISSFFLNPSNFWTQGKHVQEFERKMADFMGFRYAVFVSSGSAANTILAMGLRDSIKDEARNTVVLPSTTWQTSASPWIREGFDPHFIDINLNDFGMNMHQLESYLEKNHNWVAAVFPTTLLGCNIDYYALKSLKDKYPKVSFFIDQCENNFGNHKGDSYFKRFTCTTSTYFGHQLQSVEGGFILTNNIKEYQKFLMYRNHGLVRSLDKVYVKESDHSTPAPLNLTNGFYNDLVDPKFDFYNMGNNFRNSDIHAKIGLLDFKRVSLYIKKRKEISQIFCRGLNETKFYVPPDGNILFCLPIIFKESRLGDKLYIDQLKEYCEMNGIEYRPIISGFLGYQTPYKKYMRNKNKYPSSIHLHNNGLYVGLHTKLSSGQVKKLVKFLNEL